LQRFALTVSASNPALVDPGMILLETDLQGRLNLVPMQSGRRGRDYEVIRMPRRH
jgi:hypothetical protein